MPIRKPALVCMLLFCLPGTAGCQWLGKQSWLPAWLPGQGDTETAADPGQAEIARLHEQASLALIKDRLTVPANDNAVLYYRQILTLDPHNDKARQGLAAVVERYCSLARTAHNNGEAGKARKYLQRAESIAGPSSQTRAVAAALQKPAGQQPRDLARSARKRYTAQQDDLSGQQPARGKLPKPTD